MVFNGKGPLVQRCDGFNVSFTSSVNDDAQEDDDDGADEEDGDDSSWREDALIYMLGKLTRRRWRIF